MAEGIRLYHLMPGAKLVVSGGVVRDGDGPIAGLMAAFLRQSGIPGDAVIVEANSRNTYENLLEIRKITGGDAFILVTSACDLWRAAAVARKLGMNPLPAPACIWASQRYPEGMSAGEWFRVVIGRFAHPSVNRLSRLQWAYHEHLGYLWYLLLDRV
jgi:hypothetical protein